ncbi:LPS assembly lipoprotein LptE [Azospirillum halopraeferens]|uniref:LPS assembly lipoprotein LptE n=1 Tax=Azospirillum halopraeferens TaxID=34010 RepID=UPI00054FC373|nr:LPS assembly lipoprotein LptE [Azospirillum halopraeferens]
MSWSRRSLLTAAGALASAALLPGCGFRAMYGDRGAGGGAAAQLSAVAIDNIPDRRGQQLRNFLMDRFYAVDQAAAPTHRLNASIRAHEQKLAIRKDASAERAQLVLDVPYQLVEAATGKVVLSAGARALIAYNILEEQYAALATIDDAYERGLRQIADDITARTAMVLVRPS